MWIREPAECDAGSFSLGGYSTILPALLDVVVDLAEETCHPLLVLVSVAWLACGAARSDWSWG